MIWIIKKVLHYTFGDGAVIDRLDDIAVAYDKFINEHKPPKKPKGCDSISCKLCSKCPMRNACWNIERTLIDKSQKWW